MKTINEQLQIINNLKKRVQKNPNDFKVKPQKYEGRWGMKLNLTNDFKEYVDRDALLGASDEDVKWYKGFLKVHYNSEFTGDFKQYESTELKSITKHEKYVRGECCPLSGRRGEGMDVRKIERPDPLSHFINQDGSSSSNVGVDYYSNEFVNKSINMFDLSDNEMDNMGFLIGPKEAKEHIYEDVEFKIRECGHSLGLTLLQGLRRIFRIDRLQRKMIRVRKYHKEQVKNK